MIFIFCFSKDLCHAYILLFLALHFRNDFPFLICLISVTSELSFLWTFKRLLHFSCCFLACFQLEGPSVALACGATCLRSCLCLSGSFCSPASSWLSRVEFDPSPFPLLIFTWSLFSGPSEEQALGWLFCCTDSLLQHLGLVLPPSAPALAAGLCGPPCHSVGGPGLARQTRSSRSALRGPLGLFGALPPL